MKQKKKSEPQKSEDNNKYYKRIWDWHIISLHVFINKNHILCVWNTNLKKKIMFHNKTKTHFQSMYVKELQQFRNVWMHKSVSNIKII